MGSWSRDSATPERQTEEVRLMKGRASDGRSGQPLQRIEAT